jgi:hypothetical protein
LRRLRCRLRVFRSRACAANVAACRETMRGYRSSLHC